MISSAEIWQHPKLDQKGDIDQSETNNRISQTKSASKPSPKSLQQHNRNTTKTTHHQNRPNNSNRITYLQTTNPNRIHKQINHKNRIRQRKKPQR